jgi:hypothetical protein
MGERDEGTVERVPEREGVGRAAVLDGTRTIDDLCERQGCRTDFRFVSPTKTTQLSSSRTEEMEMATWSDD